MTTRHCIACSAIAIALAGTPKLYAQAETPPLPAALLINLWMVTITIQNKLDLCKTFP